MDSYHSVQRKSIAKDLVLPILIWAGIILVILNVKNLPFEFSNSQKVGFGYFVKCLLMVLLPLGLIHLFYKQKSDFGIYFPPFRNSFQLSIRAMSIAGPACMTFLLIGLLGWSFRDWPGTLTLSLAFLIVFYFVPKVTRGLPTRESIQTSNNTIIVFVIFSLLTCLVAYLTYEAIPVLSKILYYVFIVGLGEELLFRGYLQSAFNRYFGKPFKIGDVSFGWGLILAALLFGLIHALVVIPPAWPWALFTFFMGLTLGFIREKDGSILAAVLLHALLDMPLVFFGGG